jgi:hypothetical protein
VDFHVHFGVLVITLLLTFMGDALRDAGSSKDVDMTTPLILSPLSHCWRFPTSCVFWRQGRGAWHRPFHRAWRKLALLGESGSGKTVTALGITAGAERQRRGNTVFRLARELRLAADV